MDSEEAAVPDNCPLCQITPEANLKYQAAIKNFEKQYQIEQREFNFSDHTIYYIVSTKFL